MWTRAVMLGAMVVLVAAPVALAAGASLPDGRRYELVSPAAKNGVEVIAQTDKTHITPNGDAVTFAALGGFGDVEGSAFDFEYLSQRTGEPGTNGWDTRGINPLARPTTLATADANASTFVNGFTPDSSTGIYKTWRPLTDAPNAREVSNLYRITGLDRGPKTAQLMTDSVNPIPDTWFMFFGGLGVKLTQPQFAGVSIDLSHVVFESQLALTADAAPYQDLFCVLAGFGCPTQLYENVDGVVRFVGRIPPVGETSCEDATSASCESAPSSATSVSATAGRYSQTMVSADGRRIYFQVPADADSGAIYVREDGVRTEQLAPDGQLWTTAPDGSRAFFTTSDGLLPEDTDGNPDVYMYDREAPAGSRLTLISTGTAGSAGNSVAVVGASTDGDTVYFVHSGQLITDEPAADLNSLYAWHGQLRFIGALQDNNEAKLNSSRTNWGFVDSASTSRVSSDGRFVLFMTRTDAGFRNRWGFGGFDHAGHREFYLYDSGAGSLVCVSCNPSGASATADAVIDVRDNAATSASTSDSAHALSDDGRRVFFNTADPLVAEDVNGRLDAYEYDVPSSTVHLLSSGKSSVPSYFIDATATGDDVFIVTRDQLVGWDVDESYDLYDVRVGGGFPEPVRPAAGCVGEGCLPAASVAPAVGGVGSSAFRGAGDVRARAHRRAHRRCGHRRVLRRVRGKRRCVRRRAHARRADVGVGAGHVVVRVERSGR